MKITLRWIKEMDTVAELESALTAAKTEIASNQQLRNNHLNSPLHAHYSKKLQKAQKVAAAINKRLFEMKMPKVKELIANLGTTHPDVQAALIEIASHAGDANVASNGR